MVISFVWGQKAYRIPYAWKKLLAYMVIAVLIYFTHEGIVKIWSGRWLNLGSAAFLLLAFMLFVATIEKKEFAKLPVVGKYFN